MASSCPDEGLPANEGGDHRADLPFRSGGNSRPAHTEARAELRDRETYYAELRFAVHCQSRSIPTPPAGLDDKEPQTLDTIGQSFGVTRERIRQIEAKALRQLRSPERARHLRALLAAR